MSQFNPKFLEEIKEYDPELYNAVNPKTKFLIGVALDALSASQGGVTSFSNRARKYGASEEEVKEAIRMAYFISGMKVIKAAAGAME